MLVKSFFTILTNTFWFFFSQVRYSFVNNSEHIVSERVLGRIHLQGEFYIFSFPAIFIETGQNVISFFFCFFLLLSAVVIKECYFKSEYCGWASLGDNGKNWKLSNMKTFVKFPGKWELLTYALPAARMGWYGVLMVSSVDSGSPGSVWSVGWGHSNELPWHTGSTRTPNFSLFMLRETELATDYIGWF